MTSINHTSRLISALVVLSSSAATINAFTPPASNSIIQHHATHSASNIIDGIAPSLQTIDGSQSSSSSSALAMSFDDVSTFYATNPLEAAVLTCGVKASIADGIAQVRTALPNDTNNRFNSEYEDNRDDIFIDFSTLPHTPTTPYEWMSDLEFRRNLAYILYGGIFIGAACHYEYDVLFPILFGSQHTVATSIKEVLFDNFVTAPLAWLPPAYIIKALLYNYPVREGMNKYVTDIMEHGLLKKYWTIWVPAQSISFTVVPDHLRVVFMASVSFFWFILFSTVSSSSTTSSKSE